jgi:hypothetical protein
MKKVLALLIAAAFVMPAFATTKSAPKKVVKHHAKVDGTKMAGTKPDTVVPKKKKK